MLSMIFVISAVFWGWAIHEVADAIEDDDESEDQDLTGTEADDILLTGAGHDLIEANMGNDLLDGGAGDDILRGGAGNDLSIGGAGDDILRSAEGDDILLGQDGNDTLHGDRGMDIADGGAGDDLVNGGMGSDILIGGTGQDELNGGNNDDILIGGELLNTPLSEEQLDQLQSGATLAQVLNLNNSISFLTVDDGEADVLNGGAGADTLILGAGDVGTGGNASDDFMLLLDQDNSAQDMAEITDYTKNSDQILILTDDPDANPVITVEDDGDDALVLADGEVLAVVIGAAGSLASNDVILAAPLAPS